MKKKKNDLGLHPIAEILRQIVRLSNRPNMTTHLASQADIAFPTFKNVYYGKPASDNIRTKLLNAGMITKADIEKYWEFAREAGWVTE